MHRMEFSMKYKINVSGDSTYIIVKYSGNITRDIALKSTIESHVLGRKHSISNFLLDAKSAHNDGSFLDNYSFAYEDLKKANINKVACVALIVDPEDNSHNFLETVLRNAGHNVTLFRHWESAVHYLKEGVEDNASRQNVI